MPVSWAQHATGSFIQFVVGDSTIRLYVPQVAKVQVIRYSSALKVTTLEVDDVESLRMDLQVFPGDTIHPTIQPGTNLVVMSSSWAGGALGANTRLMYSESYA